MANLLAGLVAALHIAFFVLERFLWNTPTGHKIFRLTPEAAASATALAANQGVYNLFLALGLIWTLVAAKSAGSNAIRLYILIAVVGVGIYGAVTVSRNILFVQALPALMALSVPLSLKFNTGFRPVRGFSPAASAARHQRPIGG